jgi:hypothetical protein
VYQLDQVTGEFPAADRPRAHEREVLRFLLAVD